MEMEEDIVDRVDLENKHRKEKKELQAQIQALKKAAKNDKTKKKELVAEITRLEYEQKEKHEREIEALDTINFPDSSEEVEQETIKTLTKVSKAHKRRAKKEQQEKDREIQIKLQERENLLGPRHIELQTIREKLKEKKLQIYSIPSDGDCLYNAIAHQLSQSREQSVTIDELRTNIANYIRNNKEEYFPFLSNPDTFEMLTESEFEDYCEKIANTKTWGGQLEIRALSNYLKCPINVIQATGPESIEQGTEYDGPPLIITYHRHMYSLGEHFNSTQKLQSEEIE